MNQSTDPGALAGVEAREDFLARLDTMLAQRRAGLALLRVAPGAAGPAAAAAALRAGIRLSDTVAALEAGQFAVLLSMGNEDGALRVAGKILAALAREGGEAPAIGIAVAPQHGESRDRLMRAADAALYQAQRLRRGAMLAVAAESPEPPGAADDAIGSALALQEFALRYQPVVELSSGRAASAEALLRWQHPERGLLPAADFLHLLEQPGAGAEALLRQVIESALTQLRDWRDQGVALPLSINLNGAALALEGIDRAILEQLHAQHLAPGSFTVELRDAAPAALSEAATQRLFSLAAGGVYVALDDFGLGTASLATLRDLPVREIKLASRFVTACVRSAEDAAVLRALAQLGDALGLRVVAKGVESDAVRDRLAELGVRYAQGFAFAPALEAQALCGWRA